MRETQIIGLNDRAIDFLAENVKTITSKCDCPHCISEHIGLNKSVKYADALSTGMFEDGPLLNKHLLKDDSWAYEYVQHVEWSSGLCIFLALASTVTKNGIASSPISETLWTSEEIKEYL